MNCMSKQSDWGVRVTRVTNGWLIVLHTCADSIPASGIAGMLHSATAATAVVAAAVSAPASAASAV